MILSKPEPATHVAVLLLMLTVASGTALGHGVEIGVAYDPSRVFEAVYTDGEVMSYAEVKIFPPEGETRPFQIGRTDRNGKFAFVPDGPGEWRFRVDDGMGHVAVSSVNVAEKTAGEESTPQAGETITPARLPRVLAATAGLGYLMGIFGAVSLIRGVLRSRRTR